MFYSSRKYLDPFDGINFLHGRNKKRKILHGISIVIIVSSTALLAYPFLGRMAYYLSVNHEQQNPAIVYGKNKTATNNGSHIKGNIQKISENSIAENSVVKSTPTPSPSQIPTVIGAEKKNGVTGAVQNIQQTNKKSVESHSAVLKRIRIPSIQVDMTIEGGNNAKVLNKGVAWHIPGTATPDQASLYNKNFVLGAHRWAFRPPAKNTFYNLDKVKIGDTIEVLWNGKVYNYIVFNTKIVSPDAVEILEGGSENKITLFTCTPLFSSEHRLVIEARPI